MPVTRKKTASSGRTRRISRKTAGIKVQAKKLEAVDRAEAQAIRLWQFHPYRSLVEGLPAWLAIVTLFMFTVVFLQSWTIGVIATIIIVVLVVLLFDLLHNLHRHLLISQTSKKMYDGWLTRFGRALLVTFSLTFLLLFVVYIFTSYSPEPLLHTLGGTMTLIGIGLVFFLLIAYITLIVFVGFPRIRHQLSLAALLFFCYFYLFFAFSVQRISV